MYDAAPDLFKIKKLLPAVASFPLEVGFLPNTIAGGGDPLDVWVLADEPLFPGCLAPCRLPGALKATQQEKNKKTIRNDRLIAVTESSVKYAGWTSIAQMGEALQGQLESFMIWYNRQEGKYLRHSNGWMQLLRWNLQRTP